MLSIETPRPRITFRIIAGAAVIGTLMADTHVEALAEAHRRIPEKGWAGLRVQGDNRHPSRKALGLRS